ncbi:MAG: winged helix-turn-helix transcriptional regulator [Candidatus Hodarchaeales archaeon]
METDMVSEKSWSKFNNGPKVCPTKFIIKLFKKWSIEIVRDIWFGEERFSDMLKANPGLSTKVLSQRLRELEQYGIIDKIIVSKTPLRAVYQLTEKGQALNKILYDLAIFSFDYYAKELFEKDPPSRSEMIKITADIFKLDQADSIL